MVVAAVTPVTTYIGNGSANAFPFVFPVFTQDQILVTVTLTATGVTTTLAIGADYTVSGLNSAGTPASTGTITLVNSSQVWLSSGNLATGYTLQIEANFPLAQSTSIRDQGDFDRGALEDALDNLEYQIQQLQAQITILQAGSSNVLPSLVLVDGITGQTYQLVMNSGVLGWQRIL